MRPRGVRIVVRAFDDDLQRELRRLGHLFPLEVALLQSNLLHRFCPGCRAWTHRGWWPELWHRLRTGCRVEVAR